jgi:hypothetical protein
MPCRRHVASQIRETLLKGGSDCAASLPAVQWSRLEKIGQTACIEGSLAAAQHTRDRYSDPVDFVRRPLNLSLKLKCISSRVLVGESGMAG